MKYLLILVSLLFPMCANALHLKIKAANLDINTNKIAHLEGDVDQDSELRFSTEMLMTSSLPGPRVIFINSPGGYSTSGEDMINMIEAERKEGTKVICIVVRDASSMAFNLLTHCDVRLATKNARFVVHKLAAGGIPPYMRGTAKNLRLMAADLDKDDEKYRQANRKAMHLSLAMYDFYADKDTAFNTEQLLNMKYLQGVVKLK